MDYTISGHAASRIDHRTTKTAFKPAASVASASRALKVILLEDEAEVQEEPLDLRQVSLIIY
jgi:hypothetical protein